MTGWHSLPSLSLVGLPNKATSSITKAGTFALSDKLSPSAKTGHILNDLSSATLLSAGQLCEDDCIITLDKHTTCITEQGHTILTGKRNSSDGLWDIKLPILDLPQPRMHACNAIIRKDTNKKFLANYIYKSCFNPPLSTLLKVINNNHFIGWSGIDDTSVKRLLSETMATAKGHLDQEQQHLQTTKHTTHDDDAFPPTTPPTIKAYNTFTLLKNTTAYTDLTGRFPIQSTQGNNYILLTYNYDSNCILVAPLKNKDLHKITKGWKQNHHLLTSAGAALPVLHPWQWIFQWLQNRLTPQQHHLWTSPTTCPLAQCGGTCRAIRTFKNHFLAGLASMDPTFPIKQWDQLLQQAEITLNLLRHSHVHPNLSAYASIFGHFNFNKTPIAPPDTKVAVHVKLTARKSWGYHVELGYYIGPALDHYRCFKCYILATRSIRIADTVKFLPHDGTLPQITIQDQ